VGTDSPERNALPNDWGGIALWLIIIKEKHPKLLKKQKHSNTFELKGNR